MDDDKRLMHLEVMVAGLSADLRGHVTLCDGRWRVIWKLATALSAGIALAVSIAVSMLR